MSSIASVKQYPSRSWPLSFLKMDCHSVQDQKRHSNTWSYIIQYFSCKTQNFTDFIDRSLHFNTKNTKLLRSGSIYLIPKKKSRQCVTLYNKFGFPQTFTTDHLLFDISHQQLSLLGLGCWWIVWLRSEVLTSPMIWTVGLCLPTHLLVTVLGCSYFTFFQFQSQM